MKLYITEEGLSAIMEAFGCANNDGQGKYTQETEQNIVRQLFNLWPTKVREYSYLPSVQEIIREYDQRHSAHSGDQAGRPDDVGR